MVRTTSTEVMPLTMWDYFQIERASAYRRKNRALERLTILLFGKV